MIRKVAPSEDRLAATQTREGLFERAPEVLAREAIKYKVDAEVGVEEQQANLLQRRPLPAVLVLALPTNDIRYWFL